MDSKHDDQDELQEVYRDRWKIAICVRAPSLISATVRPIFAPDEESFSPHGASKSRIEVCRWLTKAEASKRGG
jgi:hypothetical protein